MDNVTMATSAQEQMHILREYPLQLTYAPWAHSPSPSKQRRIAEHDFKNPSSHDPSAEQEPARML